LEGAFCHVIGRGNRGQVIFRDTGDYARFLERLAGHVRRSGCKLYAYVLMSNHFHLLLEVGRQPLGTFMHALLTGHARYFNERWGEAGHLFQGPYQAIVCEREAHLLELVRYLHLNPVRAGLCADPAEWQWSSHRYYLGAGGGEWMAAQEAVGFFDENRQKAARAYRRFIADGMAMGHRPDFYPRSRARAPIGDREASAVLGRLCRALGGEWKNATGRERNEESIRLRALVAYFATRHLGLSTEAAGALLSRDSTAVSKAARKGALLVAQDPSLKHSLDLFIQKHAHPQTA